MRVNNFSVSHQTGLGSTRILWTTESKLLPWALWPLQSQVSNNKLSFSKHQLCIALKHLRTKNKKRQRNPQGWVVLEDFVLSANKVLVSLNESLSYTEVAQAV